MEQLSFDIFNHGLHHVDLNKTKSEPWEMTQTEFLCSSEWQVHLDLKSNSYVVYPPHSSICNIQSIGTFHSVAEAKRKYHKDQTFYQFTWDGEVSDRVLYDYPELLDAKKVINEYQKRIHIGKGEYVCIQGENYDCYFHQLDFVYYCTLSRKDFITLFDLHSSNYIPSSVNFSLALINVASIALYRSFLKVDIFKNRISSTLISTYHKVFYSRKKIHVRFSIPLTYDQNGHATQFQIIEAYSKYTYGQGLPFVTYYDEHKHQKHYILPTQFVSYCDEQGRCIEVL